MDKLFKAMQCPHVDKVRIVTFTFAKLCKAIDRILIAQEDLIPWDDRFHATFNKKYFSIYYKLERDGLYVPQQENRSVTVYERELKKLSR